MNNRITVLFASAAALTLAAGSAFAQAPAAPPAAAAPAAVAPAAAPAPPAPPSLMPAMTAPLAQNTTPMTVDLGPLGNKVYITGVVSGMGFTQNNKTSDKSTVGDLTNAQIFINKSDGEFQYFVDVGAYSLPTLGVPYTKATLTTTNTFDVMPLAYIKYAPAMLPQFSIQAGKLPTLIGDEYMFTVENSNVERGLLWNIEPLVSKGVQLNWTQGPVTFNLAFTDGYYSNEYNSISGAATWVIDPTDTLILQGEGTTKKTLVNNATTVPAFANQSLYAVIYTHTMGPWSFTPYFQYTSTPKFIAGGVGKDTNTQGYALLATYTFDAKSSLSGVSLPVRFEYLTTSGNALDGSANLLYGAGSNAYSFTVTPTYVFGKYFVRGEVSYVAASQGAFGSSGTAKDQTRGLLELGVIF